MGTQEPNYYLPKVYKKVDRIIYGVIAAPTVNMSCLLKIYCFIVYEY